MPSHFSTQLLDFANFIGGALRLVYKYGIGEATTLIVWNRLASIPGISVGYACLPSCVIGFFAVVVGLLGGGAMFLVVMFGPAYLRNDFIGTPWLTMIPALIIGPLAGLSAAAWVGIRGTRMFVKFDSQFSKVPQ